eukprot:scaffold56665_cov49-Attheya_sp.AAC.3
MHRSLERRNSRRCVVAAVALAFSILPPFSLSLYLRRSQRMEGAYARKRAVRLKMPVEKGDGKTD